MNIPTTTFINKPVFLSSMKPVNHISIKKGMKISDLVNQMALSGVMGAGRIAKASKIMSEMMSDKECTVFLGLAVFFFKQKTAYEIMPSLVGSEMCIRDRDNFDVLSQTKNIKEFLWKLGEILPESNSILKVCYEKKIPIFCPGIADSGIGLMIWGRQAEGKKFDLPVFEDMKEIISTAWDSKKNGVIYIGGGLPKNFIQQSMQFSKGASYGVQISTDMPQWGGSSGANLCEGISWGKMKEQGKYIDVYCDATIALPLIWASVKDVVE